MHDDKTPSAKLNDVHALAMKRFDAVAIPQLRMRQEALDARRFAFVPGAQWEGVWGEAFANSIRVQINKVRDKFRKIYSDYSQNRLAPDFKPDGPTADKSTAETLNGLYRADAYRCQSQEALDNAFVEAVSGGFGAWRLCNELEDEDDESNDCQRMNPGMVITDADQTVFFDGNSKRYDKRDAHWCIVLTAHTKEMFLQKFGDDKTTSWPEIEKRYQYDWFRPDLILTGDYYIKESIKDTLLVMTQRVTKQEQRAWESSFDPAELTELRGLGWKIAKQSRKRTKVRKYVLSGADVLEDCGYIAGPNIPVVPVYGERQFIDGQERFKGCIQDDMDKNRLLNAQVSKLAEMAALAPQERPIFDPEQMPPNLASQWANANIDRHAFSLVNSLRNADGSIVQAGPIGYTKPPDVPPTMAALLQIMTNEFADDNQDSSEVVKANTSADAMDIAAARVDAKSGGYLDNMRKSIQRGAEIYQEALGDVMFEDGRKVYTMSEDGDDGEAVIKQPYTDEAGVYQLRNDFSRGKYKAIASVSETTSTRRDKTVRQMMNIANVAGAVGDTGMAQAALITAIINQDGEGLDDFQKFVRAKGIEMQLITPNEDEKAKLDQQAENAAPDPATEALMAQAEELTASAKLKTAQADKAVADTGLSEAKTMEILHTPFKK